MKFWLSRVSNSETGEVVELASLDDLLALARKEGEPLILYLGQPSEPMPVLEIYDDWKER